MPPDVVVLPPGFEGRLSKVEAALDAIDRIERAVDRLAEKMEALQRLEQQQLTQSGALDRAFVALSKQAGRTDELERVLAEKMGWIKGAWFAFSLIATVSGGGVLAAGGYLINHLTALDTTVGQVNQSLRFVEQRLAVLERGTGGPVPPETGRR